MSLPLQVQLVREGIDTGAMASTLGVIVAAIAIYFPLKSRRDDQREAQLTFRNVTHIAFRRAADCALRTRQNQPLGAVEVGGLRTALGLLDKLEWRALRPGPMTYDFAEIHLAVAEVSARVQPFGHAANLTVEQGRELQKVHDDMVTVMAGIDARLKTRRYVRFRGDVAWYRGGWWPF